MLKNFLPALVLGTLLATSLVSCKKDTIQELEVVPNTPTLVDGRLKFSSLASFHNYLKANENKTVEELMQTNRDMGFVSHLRSTNEPGLEHSNPAHPSILSGSQIKAKDNSAQSAAPSSVLTADEPLGGPPLNQIESTIPDPLFAFVLDDDREAEIGTIIYRAGNDYCFYYPIGQEALVDDFYERVAAGEIYLDDTELHAFGDLLVNRTGLVTNPGEAGTNSTPIVDNRRVKDVKNWDDNHRIEGEIWEGNWLIYASSGIKTQATQYARKWLVFHGWLDLKADQVSALAKVTYTVPITGAPPLTGVASGFDISETNASVAVRRFDWSTAQIGYTNGGLIPQQVYIVLSQRLITIPNPNIGPTQPASLTVNFNTLQSVHRGTWNGKTIELPLTW